MKRTVRLGYVWAVAFALAPALLLVPSRALAKEAVSGVRSINTRSPSWDLSSMRILDTTKVGFVIMIR